MNRYFLVACLALTACEISTQTEVNGKIKSDSNFAKIGGIALNMHNCLRTSTNPKEQCGPLVFQNQDGISDRSEIVNALPAIAAAARTIEADISWDDPTGTILDNGDSLYTINGTSKYIADQNTCDIQFQVVQQNDTDLFIFEIDYRPAK